MAQPNLRIAVTAGPMYDRLYERLDAFSVESGIPVEVGFRGPHPQLNRHLAEVQGAGYDLISTHTKYAPSQRGWLARLDALALDILGSDFFSAVVDLARIDGELYSVPRNLDVRLLHYRTDLMDAPPKTWDELLAMAKACSRPPDFHGFVYCGVESGLFGTFFEWAESAGARLFPESLIPELRNPGGRWALGLFRSFYESGAVPQALIDWHYDEVHSYFRDGHAAMVCDWPAYYRAYSDPRISAVSDRFGVARMPAGPTGRHAAYAGCHSFALTIEGARKSEALELLRFLTAPGQQMLEALEGSVPVRVSVMDRAVAGSTGADAQRWRLLRQVIECDLIVPPKLSCYPQIEEVLWQVVRGAMLGHLTIDAAVEQIERRVSDCIEKQATHAA